ncbi:hypothetical protein [Asticcacaulis sp. EMRT-3]|uniref:hypothetical protein n=1 Tax=Asticcacaulis sp. EMRT-3 TaxID=3040349 RepID=UPI0024AFB1E7|nr:hypothetical protein [Asticcacaulis sp. EMRT-3]MDI7774817.1 hypothetical protein [Asticcacaulis sp. EMRT-3]
MIGSLINKWSLSTQLKEASQFVSHLSVMDSDEIALVVAFVAHWRNVYIDEKDIDLRQCIAIQGADPLFVLSLGNVLREAQKRKSFHDAAGLMVWLHSLRAGNSFENRGKAREMWGHLSRGFSKVFDAANEQRRMFGRLLDIDGFDEFPDGLTPEPK